MYTVSNHVLGLSKLDSIKKNIVIHFPNGEYADIENDSIYSESMKLQQSICSQEYLQFGLCEAAQFSIKLIGVEESLKGYEIEVSMYLDGDTENMVQLGSFKIDSDVPTDNKRFREIKAYDVLYGLNDLDISNWYNSLTFPMTLKEFRDSLFVYLGIEQEEIVLVNDEMVVERTISPTEMPATDILKAICEINGAFGQIGRNGKFKYVILEKPDKASYPSNDLYPSDTLFPNDGATESFQKSLYISCEYEDYEVQGITGIQIRQEENDIGVIVGENSNAYVVEDNFLVYGKGTEELKGIANKLLDRITGIVFRPCELEAKALLYLEPGDYVKIYTNRLIFCTYILNRTISGIQSLKDSISSTCEREQNKKVGGVHHSIIQLKKKTNTLDRTLEETRSTLTNLETTIEDDYSTTEEMESYVSQTAEGITTSVSKQITETRNYAATVAGNAESNANANTDAKLKNYSTTTEMKSLISQSAEGVKSEVSKTYVTKSSVQESVNNLQQQIDGAIETFSGSEKPTLSNLPASEWLDDATKDIHIGDLYIVNADGGDNAGFYYRFEKTSVGYQWTLLKDNEITKALQDAKEANEKAQAVEDDLKKNYSTTIEMKSAISQTAESINLEVSKKVGNDEVISKINQTAESIVISALKIDIDGVLDVEKLNALKIKAGSVAAENITGDTITGKKISGGSISIGSKFSVDTTGKATVADIEVTGNGSIDFEYASMKMSLSAQEIKFGYTNWNTTINKDKVQVYNNYIDQDGIWLGSVTSQYLEILVDAIKYKSSTVLGMSATDTYLYAPTYLKIGKSSNYLGFFGSSGVQKKTVANIASSATLATVVSTLNSLIDALQAYGLIG